MTRSSTKELLTPFENPEQVLRSRKKLFDTPSLVESNSLEFDQLSEIEDHIEEEVTEIMTETMEHYMSKTRGEYGSSVTRPSINQDTRFELKGQFLKELRDNTFCGLEHEDANEHIEQVLEIVDLFHIPKNQPLGSITTWEEPDESLFRAWERFKELLMKCPQHYLTDTQELILFYKGSMFQLDKFWTQMVPIPSKTAADAKIAIQKWLNIPRNGTMKHPQRLEEAHELKILDAIDHNLPQKEKDPWSFTLPCFINNVCFDKAIVDLGASVSIMPFSTYINLGLGGLSHTRLTIELADGTIKQLRGIAENVLVRIGKFIFPIDFIILDIPKDNDVSLILERLFLSTAHVKIDVFKRKVTLRAGEEKLVFKSIKPASSMIKRVFME
nr:hypothetical protein [Tanacetum cinerariifolium]